MENIENQLAPIFEAGQWLKVIISNPRQSSTLYKKQVIEKKTKDYQLTMFTEKQVYHKTLTKTEVFDYCVENFGLDYKQLNVWLTDQTTYTIKSSKKGKISINKSKEKNEIKVNKHHNRKKAYLLEEGTTIEPLVDMGVFTKEGQIKSGMHDKFKQINKFLEILDDVVTKSNLKKLNIIDFGCGKSYLTFVAYYYLTFIKNIDVEMTGLDLKADVIKKCNHAAKRYGYKQLKFEQGNIENYDVNNPIDLVITLHACDTATDYALHAAIKWNVNMILSVPCCQHEINQQLKQNKKNIMQRYGIVQERHAALLTDAIRGNLLQYAGYKVQLLEFIDFASTPKNIMIKAVKSNIPHNHKQKVLDEVLDMVNLYDLNPTLMQLLNIKRKN